MKESKGVKKRPRGLSVFGSTGKSGSEAVVLVPKLKGDPEQPEYLDVTAQQEWHRITRILRDLGTLSPAWGAAIGLYCQQFSLLRMAEGKIAEHGLVVERDNGICVESPYVAVVRQAATFCQRSLASFGLTPTRRGKVDVPPPRDEIEDFLVHGS